MYDGRMQGEKVPPAAPRDTRLTYEDFTKWDVVEPDVLYVASVRAICRARRRW